MNTDENNQEDGAQSQEGAGEGEQKADVVLVPKSEYEKLHQDLGSLKRELKDLKKPKEEAKEDTSKTNAKPDERLLERVEKMALRTAGITHEDDIDLARRTAKKWNIDLEEVLLDDDFKVKLEKQQNARANVQATSKVRGGAGTSQAKNTPEYWIAKGAPPTTEDVPDRKTRATIARAFLSNKKSSKTFYND